MIKCLLLKLYDKSALEPLNCTVFCDFKWVRKYFSPLFFFKFIFLFQKNFRVGMSVVLLNRLYMSCAPFLLFKYILIEMVLYGLPLYTVPYAS